MHGGLCPVVEYRHAATGAPAWICRRTVSGRCHAARRDTCAVGACQKFRVAEIATIWSCAVMVSGLRIAAYGLGRTESRQHASPGKGVRHVYLAQVRQFYLALTCNFRIISVMSNTTHTTPTSHL
ncbi:hypothetical protein CT19431_MP120028 [Cupriavidus taiwanensis]|nr:hypothetical protein CT19431_MP120028 [Cupriavidus taiwanensis]